jgi:hypothetical protein
MVQSPSSEPLEQMQQAGVHRIDMIPILEFLETAGTTLRAAANCTKMVPIPARYPTFLVAIPALVNCQIIETLPERTVHALEPRSAA